MYKIPRLSRLNLGYAKFWGCSSVGRAPDLQAGGRQFEPDQLHQNNRKGMQIPFFKKTDTNSPKGVNT